MRCRGSLIALATDEIVMSPNAAFELPVSTDTPADVYGFMELFRQPRERIPSAQYIPILARQRGGQQNQ
jgi:hypothetical protein